MDDREYKHHAKMIFNETFGLTLEDIETQPEQRTPDFLLAGKIIPCLIEMTVKNDDPDELESISEELKSGEVVSRETPAGRRNRLDAIVGDKVDQLDSFDPNGNCFHVIWIHCAGRDPDFLSRRFSSTLYGLQDLFTIDDDRPLMNCYYFHNSSFFKYRDCLDGVILSFGESMQLIINSVSPRVMGFRASELVEVFRSKNGIYDPSVYEGDNDFMIVDSDINRNDTEEVLNYLRTKYGLRHLQTIDMKRHEGIISVEPPEELN